MSRCCSTNGRVMIIVAILVVVVGVFAYLNAGDAGDRLASQREAEIYIAVDGERVATVEFDTIEALGQHTFTETLRSSSAADRDHEYTGVMMRDLFEHLDLNLEGADQVITRAVDGYTVALTVEEVLEDGNVYIVYEVNGEPLAPKEEGGTGPYQVVIRQDQFAQRWNKFLMELELR